MGFTEGEASIGEVLVSFSLVPDDYRFKIPCEYMNLTEFMDFKEYNIEINCLGLRMLQSFGLMPVKKPFVKFNLRSLLPPEKAKAIQNVQTNPQDTGSNPNINTTVSFIMHLPSSSLFCPRLSCDVYDMVFKGWIQPLLGTFSIPIGDILEETKKNQSDEIEESDFMIRELKKVLMQGGLAKSGRILEEEEKGPIEVSGLEESKEVSNDQIQIEVEDQK